MKKIQLLILLSFAAGIANAQLAYDSLPNQSHGLIAVKMEEYEREIAPYVAQARETLPGAKRKYVGGLGLGQTLFLAIWVRNDQRIEQVLVRVTKWQGKKIVGVVARDLTTVGSYQAGPTIKFKEVAVLDWLIVHPDGSEEGDFVGNFMGTQHQ